MREIMLAEFETPEMLLHVLLALREQDGFRLDAYTPYPVDEIQDAIAPAPSRLPFAIFLGGLLGAGGGYTLQWYLNAYLYPLDVGKRPPHMPSAFVPITFEMGVLFAAFTAFLGVLVTARLLHLWQPIFEVDGFERASIDRFWLRIEHWHTHSDSEPFEALKRHIIELGALRVVRLHETGESR